ncbi:MAG: PhoU domain-containing protein [Candidatus Woesearchaeota archaeon]
MDSMDIRKIQKTGDMHYMYLPTSWCREHKIGAASKVGIRQGSGGSLVITPKLVDKKRKKINLSVSEDNLEIINKLVVACYINPLDSFTINLEKALDQRKLLDQKRLLSVELMEIEGKKVTCESSFGVSEPDILLRTLVSKIKNMLIVMTRNYNEELIQRYEEEIDRNRLLIDKSVISSITFNRETRMKTINLHYISLIAKDLERMVDHLILVDRKDKAFIESITELMSSLKDVIEVALDPEKSLDYNYVIKFARKIFRMKEDKVVDIKSYYKIRVRHYFGSISEVLMDWAVTNLVEQ